jgi:hypothetical protein
VYTYHRCFFFIYLAIREDRTRGGRSTYQCSYSLPPSLTNHAELRASSTDLRQNMGDSHHGLTVKLEPADSSVPHHKRGTLPGSKGVPALLQVSSVLRPLVLARTSFDYTLKHSYK